MTRQEIENLQAGDEIKLVIDSVDSVKALSGIELDFTKSHKITEIYIFEYDAEHVIAMVGFEDYKRIEADTLIVDLYADSTFNNKEAILERLMKTLGRETIGHIIMTPLDAIVPASTYVKTGDIEVGDMVKSVVTDFGDVVIGTTIYEKFGVDVFDNTPRKVTECIKLHDDEDNFDCYLIALEGVHRREPLMITEHDRIYTLLKNAGIEREEYGDCFPILSCQLIRVN
jgi:hypothetical protein